MEYSFFIKEPNNFETLKLDEDFDNFGYFIINDILYLYGGTVNNNLETSKKYMYTYDIKTNTWNKFEDENIPTNLCCSSSCVYNGNVYFFGGQKNRFIQKYNFDLNEWDYTGCGYITVNNGIDMSDYCYCCKPYIIDNKAYFGAATNHPNFLNLPFYEYDLDNNVLNHKKISNSHASYCKFFKPDIENNKVFQCVNLSGNLNTIQYTKYDFDNSNKITGYTKTYSTSSVINSIVTELDNENVIDIRPNFNNNNRLTIKILNINKDFTNILYDDIDEIQHNFEDKISFLFSTSQCTNIVDSNGVIFVPFFSNNEKTEIKLLTISKLNYIINSDQTIETTTNNNIKQIDNVIKSSIEYELKDNTEIRIALSIDDKNTYKYYDGNNWLTCTNKKLVENNQGMTPEIFSNLTDNDYKKLITDICNIDILVSLYSKDSYATPKIKSISFKTNKLY